MKLARKFLNLTLAVLVFLTVFTAGYVFLYKTLVPLINREIVFKGSKTQVQKITGTVVLSYLKDDRFHLTIKSWDTAGRYIFNTFEGANSIRLTQKEASPNAAPKLEEKINPGDLKPGDEVVVGSFTNSAGVRELASVTRVSASASFSELTGVVESLADHNFVLNVDLAGQQRFEIGLEGSVLVGSLFRTEKINGKEVQKPGTANPVKNFNLLKFGNRAQVFYAKNDGPVIVARQIFVLD